jgi:hypothetical protein
MSLRWKSRVTIDRLHLGNADGDRSARYAERRERATIFVGSVPTP